jgi:hypothetical protein
MADAWGISFWFQVSGFLNWRTAAGTRRNYEPLASPRFSRSRRSESFQS